MVDWDNKDTKTVYRMVSLIGLFLFVVLLSVFIIAFYLSFPIFTLPLIPELFIPANWVIFFFYPFGLRIVSLLEPNTSFATYTVITPLAVLLMTVFVVSWVVLVALSWYFPFVGYLKDVKGYERYRNARMFTRSLMKEGTMKEKILLTSTPILLVAVFSLLTVAILNMTLLYFEAIKSPFLWSALFFLLTCVLVVSSFRIRGFFKKRLPRAR